MHDNPIDSKIDQTAGEARHLRLVRCFVCRSNYTRTRQVWSGDETIQKHGIWIECEHCESRGPRCGTVEDAVAEWNATTGIHRAAASFLEASTLLNISPHDWPTQRYYQRRKRELQAELESITADEGCENAEHPIRSAVKSRRPTGDESNGGASSPNAEVRRAAESVENPNNPNPQ